MTKAADSGSTLKFGGNSAFQLELRRRVDEHFRATGRRERDCWQMYLKTAIILACLAVSYLLLVFAAQAWWQGVPLAVLLGLAAAGIGFNVQHDGGHHAYSDYRSVNKLMAMTLDLMGGSSYFWHWKHVVFHHTYVNVAGHDTDINLGVLGRVTPHQTRLAFHRWQHLYLWPLYGLAGGQDGSSSTTSEGSSPAGLAATESPALRGGTWSSSWPARRPSSPGPSGSRCSSTP